jgi:hypothetical protein
MNLEEFRLWLEKNRNREEVCAYEIVKEVLWYHRGDKPVEVQVFPRKKVNGFEFDIFIVLTFKGEKKDTRRTIGIELKETDVEKVVRQAILRRNSVDYQYVALKDVSLLNYRHLMILDLFGVGLIFWSEKNRYAKLVVPSKYYYELSTLEDFFDEILDYVKEQLKKRVVQRTLESFL